MKEELIILQGEVVGLSQNGVFKIKVGDQEIICKSAGKFRRKRTKIVIGDIVEIGVSPYDMTKGLIYERKTNQ